MLGLKFEELILDNFIQRKNTFNLKTFLKKPGKVLISLSVVLHFLGISWSLPAKLSSTLNILFIRRYLLCCFQTFNVLMKV